MTTLVDYGQTASDHRALLVLVQHIGSQLQPQNFNGAFEKIMRVSRIRVQGEKRDILIKYRNTYSMDFNSWGDFQAHRKVLGLIAVGKCSDHNEFENLFLSYKSIKEKYSSTIINSRLIMFGMNTDGSPIIKDSVDDNGNEAVSKSDIASDVNTKVSENSCENKQCVESSGKNPSPSTSSNSYVKNGNLQTLTEHEEEHSVEGGNQKTAEDSLSNTDNVAATQEKPTPKLPERRPHSNSLTKESSGAEIVFYPNLDKCSDFEERVKEFVTSLYYVLEGKRLDRSFERSEKPTLLCAPFEKKDYIGVDTDTKSFRKKCMGRLRKHLGDLCLQAALPGEAVLHYNTALDLLRAVNDFLWMGGCLEGLCCASVILAYPKPSPAPIRRNLSFQTKRGNVSTDTKVRSGSSYSNGLDTLAEGHCGAVFNLDDVIEKYKEAITFYCKFKSAAMIELEASLKACRFLIQQRKRLEASDFLQNVVYITAPLQADDKIDRYLTLSNLYKEIGFKRKAGFFKRVSGMHCIIPDASPKWSQCYDIMLQCMEGYDLSVNPTDMDKRKSRGWPVLQYSVLSELIYAARRTSNPQIAVRHMALMVHRLLTHINVNEQREVLSNLTTLSSKCPGSALPIPLDSGLILPPVPLLWLPTVKWFRLLPPSPHLRPKKTDTTQDPSASGVFIYTPLSLGTKKMDDSKPDFQWVCGDICEVSLQVSNPLVDELKLTSVTLMTSDLEVETYAATPIVPSESLSSQVTVKLKVKPKAVGRLKVTGYSTVLFGVASNCYLKDLMGLKSPPLSNISIEVIPPLPQISLACSLPKSNVFAEGGGKDVVVTGSAVLFAGQSTECILTLQNMSESPVERVSVKLDSKGETNTMLSRVLQWSEENIASQLPLQPTNQLCFSLCIFGDSNFLYPLEAAIRSPSSQSSRRSDSTENKVVDTILSLSYSGGEGMEAGYSRQCSLALNIDILPSVCIAKWDVQPTDSPSHCRLCLDLVNMSANQIEVQYGQGKALTLYSQQTRRIGVEIPRLDPCQVDLNSSDENCVPAFYKSRASPDPYSLCIKSMVDIVWNMPSAKASGKVAIDYIKWTPEQLSVLLMCSVHWDIQVNGQRYNQSSRLKFAVADVVHVSVTVENTAELWPSDSLMCVQPSSLQANESGSLDESSFAVLGSQTFSFHEQTATKVLTHSCSFVFFTTGFFCFNVFVSPNPMSTATTPTMMGKDKNSSLLQDPASLASYSNSSSNLSLSSINTGKKSAVEDLSGIRTTHHYRLPAKFEVR